MRSKSFEAECTEKEQYFGTKHIINKISDQLLAKMNNPKCEIKTKKLALPPRNNLIPTNFDILAKDE